MDNLEEIFGDFTLHDDNKNKTINYRILDVFKNPNKLPINEVYIERTRVALEDNRNWTVVESKKRGGKGVVSTKEVIPALHASWLPDHIPVYPFQVYVFDAPPDDNLYFLENWNYVTFLEYLVTCSYHHFWCSVLFRDDVVDCLRDFLVNPIPTHLYRDMELQYRKVYKAAFNAFFMVLRRLICFRESPIEFMDKTIGAKYLFDRKLFDLRTVVTIALLYQDFDHELIKEVSEIYFTYDKHKKIVDKEVESLLKDSIVIFEMITGFLTDEFEPGFRPVPISLEERPRVFSVDWINSLVNYLTNSICTLQSLFRLRKTVLGDAITLKLPYKLPRCYDLVFQHVYDLIDDREEMKSVAGERIMEKLGLARSKFVETFHEFVVHLLDQTINKNSEHDQQTYVETFTNIMTAALEYEIFICDYDFKHEVFQTVETFKDFSSIDPTRIDYIVNTLCTLERHEFVKQKFSFVDTFHGNIPRPSTVEKVEEPEVRTVQPDDMDEKIRTIQAIFPHLGDGFLELCLQNYEGDVAQVTQAILEGNLPPHIVEVTFDLPRIPPEPEPAKPSLAYYGKKPNYDDALAMLNDKKEKDKMKTFILDGIKYNNRYDISDDEYDDTNDLVERDYVVEPGPERYDRPSAEDDSDASTESETPTTSGGFKPFCEDPAVVRERRAAAQAARGRRNNNVVGRPKGQGQDKNVLIARDKKNTQKSSRANHNRKGGSQFKRNRGMIPS